MRHHHTPRAHSYVRHLAPTSSLGFAVYPEDGQDADTLLKNADAAMYHAKELGRNSFRAFSHALAQRRDERLGVEQALRR